MKYNILLVFLYSSFLFAQKESKGFEIEKFPSRIRLSGEVINMSQEPDIGFLGHGYEVFGLLPKYKNVYFGVNSYAALTGIRSGFIVFGVSGGIQKRWYKDWLSYDTGLYLGGGGGNGAADGGGLIVRPHFDVQASVFKNIALRAGVSAITFPSGAIDSFHVSVGVVVHTDTYLINKIIAQSRTTENTNLLFNHLAVSASSMNLFNFKKGPIRPGNPNDPSSISLVGVTLKTHQKKSVYGLVKLGGAFTGGVDGFMMLLSGIGYQKNITRWLYLTSGALIGGAGGGDVDFGGGLATQIEAGLGVNYKDYYVQVNGGNTYAPNGNFQSNHLDVSLGKRFDLYKSTKEVAKEVVVSEKIEKEGFNFSVFNRTYIPNQDKDKNGRVYDTAFNLIGFEIAKELTTKTSVVAATVWAYQGSYGAYAEGWLGLNREVFKVNQWRFSVKGLLGAGGGGGINLGSGLAYQYNVNVHKKMNSRWSFIASVGQVRPVKDGNFTPVLVDVGVKLNISQLVKK